MIQSALLDKAFELLLEHLCGFSHSIGFPELVLPVTLRVSMDHVIYLYYVLYITPQLSKVAKATKVPWLSRQLKQLVTKVTDQS